MPLRLKGESQSSRKNSVKKTPKVEKGKKPSPKKTTIADVAGTRQVPKLLEVEYNKCVVSLAIRVDKGKNSKGAFDKKLAEGLSFIQKYLDKQACFFPFGKDQTLAPMKEKADLPKFQVVLQNYFSIPNKYTFSDVSQDGGRIIKGPALMGFSKDPRQCLDEANGDL